MRKTALMPSTTIIPEIDPSFACLQRARLVLFAPIPFRLKPHKAGVNTMRSMIGLGLNRIRRDLRRFHLTCRLPRNV